MTVTLNNASHHQANRLLLDQTIGLMD